MRAKRTDDNQQEIINALRQIGCTVADTSGAGMGFPDLVIGFFGRNYLLEVKSGSNKLTPAQANFHIQWRGDIRVVRSVDEAIKAVTG